MNNLVIPTIKNHTNTTILLTSHHQLQTCLCSSKSQTCPCNNLQSSTCPCNSQSQMCPCYNLQLSMCLCNSHCHCSPLYCQLHYQLLPSFHLRSSSSLRHHFNAHQRFINASSIPFQRTTKQFNQDDTDLKMFNFRYTRISRQQVYSCWKHEWNNQQEETYS